MLYVSFQEQIKTWEVVEIPNQFKGLIIGKGGANLREIYKQTGAEVTRTQYGEVQIISGTKEQREHVKDIIALKVVGRSFIIMTNFYEKMLIFLLMIETEKTEVNILPKTWGGKVSLLFKRKRKAIF